MNPRVIRRAASPLNAIEQSVHDRCDGLTPVTEISRQTGLSSKRVFAVLDRLADLGLLEVRPAPPTAASFESRRGLVGRIAAAAGLIVTAPAVMRSEVAQEVGSKFSNEESLSKLSQTAEAEAKAQNQASSGDPDADLRRQEEEEKFRQQEEGQKIRQQEQADKIRRQEQADKASGVSPVPEPATVAMAAGALAALGIKAYKRTTEQKATEGPAEPKQ
ncbi:MAG: helix-turn-helix domain-containing protein [Acidobacteria bacterium]|nr:helix-turn-helix domain-containing protein [Acidobacteriota bacterium]